MSAYVIFDGEIRDMERYQAFMKGIKPAPATQPVTQRRSRTMSSNPRRTAASLRAVCLVLACCGAGNAVAQADMSHRLHCFSVGFAAPEALGDRDGHAISANQIVCRVEGGLTDGGVMHNTAMYEWDKTNAVMLSSAGITRKPGAMSAFQQSEGRISLVLADGKVTGANYSGRGRVTLATGAAAVLMGKTYSYAGKSTGPGQFVLEVKYD